MLFNNWLYSYSSKPCLCLITSTNKNNFFPDKHAREKDLVDWRWLSSYQGSATWPQATNTKPLSEVVENQHRSRDLMEYPYDNPTFPTDSWTYHTISWESYHFVEFLAVEDCYKHPVLDQRHTIFRRAGSFIWRRTWNLWRKNSRRSNISEILAVARRRKNINQRLYCGGVNWLWVDPVGSFILGENFDIFLLSLTEIKLRKETAEEKKGNPSSFVRHGGW